MVCVHDTWIKFLGLRFPLFACLDQEVAGNQPQPRWPFLFSFD